MGGCVTASSAGDSNTTCPDLDIEYIRFKSNYWEAYYDDQDGGDIFVGNYGDFWEDYHISNRDNYPGMDKYSVKCSGGDCNKASVFHRRVFPIYGSESGDGQASEGDDGYYHL